MPTSASWTRVILAAQSYGTLVAGVIERARGSRLRHNLFCLNGLCCVHRHGPFVLGILQTRRAPCNSHFSCVVRQNSVIFLDHSPRSRRPYTHSPLIPQTHITLRLEIRPRFYLVQFLRSTLRLLGIVSSIPRMVLQLLPLAILLPFFSWACQTRAKVGRRIPSQHRLSR